MEIDYYKLVQRSDGSISIKFLRCCTFLVQTIAVISNVTSFDYLVFVVY